MTCSGSCQRRVRRCPCSLDWSASLSSLNSSHSVSLACQAPVIFVASLLAYLRVYLSHGRVISRVTWRTSTLVPSCGVKECKLGYNREENGEIFESSGSFRSVTPRRHRATPERRSRRDAFWCGDDRGLRAGTGPCCLRESGKPRTHGNAR